MHLLLPGSMYRHRVIISGATLKLNLVLTLMRAVQARSYASENCRVLFSTVLMEHC